MQIQHLHYAVDIDIQGFFDNVNHGKLISQMWEMGIRDKKLLCIVKQMLKAQVVLPDGTRTTPTKGTPQGGILSPLLSNIVLNELDWWVTSQWEEMPTHYEYKTRQNAHGTDIHISVDFPKLSYGLKLQMANRLRELTPKGKLERGFIKERYGKSKQLRFLNGHPLIPMGYVQTRNAQHKKKTVNRYTSEGRAEIHKNLGINTDTMIWLMQNPVLDKTIEFADNRISLFAAQYGRCAITGIDLMPYDIRCHHKVPLENGGTDEYSNLVLVTEAVHILIHATLEETI